LRHLALGLKNPFGGRDCAGLAPLPSVKLNDSFQKEQVVSGETDGFADQ